MNKKIKIIELYNLIANKENLPQRIVYKGVIYNWDNSRYLHYEDKISNEEAFLEGICTEMVLNDYIEILNDEVLEDNTEEIEKLECVNYITTGGEKDLKDFVKKTNKVITDNFYLVNKIIENQNKLARAVNKIRKEKE